MESPDALITPQSRLEIRKLQLRSNRRTSADLMGQYRSSFRGSGLLFSDLRVYEPGDDIKNIHWKVTARTGKPYVKTFEEERQLNILLVIDISNSTNYGSPKSNFLKALEFAALITTLAQRSQDSCGLLLFADEIIEYIKPSSKRTQFQRIMSSLLLKREHQRGTNINQVLQFLQKNLRRPSVVFLLSDFYSTDYKDALKGIGARHDLIGVNLVDNFTDRIDDLGLVEFEDAEGSGRVVLDTSNKRVRRELSNYLNKRNEEIRSAFRQARGDLIEIDKQIIKPLIDLMARRTVRH